MDGDGRRWPCGLRHALRAGREGRWLVSPLRLECVSPRRRYAWGLPRRALVPLHTSGAASPSCRLAARHCPSGIVATAAAATTLAALSDAPSIWLSATAIVAPITLASAASFADADGRAGRRSNCRADCRAAWDAAVYAPRSGPLRRRQRWPLL